MAIPSSDAGQGIDLGFRQTFGWFCNIVQILDNQLNLGDFIVIVFPVRSGRATNCARTDRAIRNGHAVFQAIGRGLGQDPEGIGNAKV